MTLKPSGNLQGLTMKHLYWLWGQHCHAWQSTSQTVPWVQHAIWMAMRWSSIIGCVFFPLLYKGKGSSVPFANSWHFSGGTFKLWYLDKGDIETGSLCMSLLRSVECFLLQWSMHQAQASGWLVPFDNCSFHCHGFAASFQTIAVWRAQVFLSVGFSKITVHLGQYTWPSRSPTQVQSRHGSSPQKIGFIIFSASDWRSADGFESRSSQEAFRRPRDPRPLSCPSGATARPTSCTFDARGKETARYQEWDYGHGPVIDSR